MGNRRGGGVSPKVGGRIAARSEIVTFVGMAEPIRSPDPVPDAAGSWPLAEAGARFGELVRRVRSEGPQRVAVPGQDDVVVISADEFYRLRDATGAALVAALQASPDRDVEIEPERFATPVREAVL